jgi:hypothetical protein
MLEVFRILLHMLLKCWLSEFVQQILEEWICAIVMTVMLDDICTTETHMRILGVEGTSTDRNNHQ